MTHIERTHEFQKVGVVVFQCFFSLSVYCENQPVGLLRTPYHGYFSPGSANRVLRTRPPSPRRPMGERISARGGATVAVSHRGEAGGAEQTELGYRSYSTRRTAALCENHFYPSASNINRGPTDDVKTRQIPHINAPMDY